MKISLMGSFQGRKKTSLIRFPAKGEEPIQITKGDLDAETSNKGLH